MIFRHPDTTTPTRGLRSLLMLLAAILLAPALCSVGRADARPRNKELNRQYADQKLLHLGFSVGAHFQDLSLTHNGFVSDDGQQWVAEVPAFSPGFCVNVLGDLRLHKYLNLRLTPGMYFGSKTVEMMDYNNPNPSLNPDEGFPSKVQQTVKSAYVVVPLDLKVSGDRLNNVRPYVTVGTMATFDVSKKRSEYLTFNTADVYLSVGLGCDFYMPFFKFIPEIKFCFGLTDILKHDRPDLVDNPHQFIMTQSLRKVKSNMVVINFYFE